VQKKEAVQGEKPEPVRTHLRDMVIVPEMIGSVIGVYNGKTFNQVEIKVRQACLPPPRMLLHSRTAHSLALLTLATSLPRCTA
jgi:hypothetical protein